MGSIEVFLAGSFGGLANEILHWYGLRTNTEFPEYARRPFYWAITAAMILIGGSCAFFQLSHSTDYFMAFQIGLLAPLLLKKISANAGQTSGSMSLDERGAPSVRSFLRG